MQCPSCGSKDIDFYEAGGHSACVSCGTVVEENVIVSSIEFQESGDRSSVVGQFVSASSSKPFNSAASARGRYGNNRDSRDATLANARRIINQVASSLRLPSLYVDKAYRYYNLAIQKNFIMGRRAIHVVATCLYTVCRTEKSPHLLIDFSDALQINIYVLGKSFLQLSRVLKINLPVVDPSLYIHRFAARLDLGDKLGIVITTALRIVTRLKKDWIATGRRPDGVCAVAILIASRCHGFYISQGEIAKLFRISSDTLAKRIIDFRATPAAQLTVEQFHIHDFDVEYDPPSFISGQIAEAGNNGVDILSLGVPATNDDDDDVDSDYEVDEEGRRIYVVDGVTVKKVMLGGVEVNVPVPGQKKKRKLTVNRQNKNISRKALYDNIYADIGEAATNESAEALRIEAEMLESTGAELGGWSRSNLYQRPVQTTVNFNVSVVGAQVGKGISLPINEDREDNNDTEVDVDDYLLDETEQNKRAAIWEQNFRPFMDDRRRRREAREENDGVKDGGRGKKKYNKRDAPRESASQAVFDGQGKRASKKINYDALQGAFTGDGSFKMPTNVVIDPSLNVYAPGNRGMKNVKPVIDSTVFPFASSSSFSSKNNKNNSNNSYDIKAFTEKAFPVPPRKTFSLSQQPSSHTSKDKTSSSSSSSTALTDIPVKAGVKSGSEAQIPDDNQNALDDEEDMLMYDEGGDNEDDYDDDEEY